MLVVFLLLTLFLQIYFSQKLDFQDLWANSCRFYSSRFNKNIIGPCGGYINDNITSNNNDTDTTTNETTFSKSIDTNNMNIDQVDLDPFHTAKNKTLGFHRIEYINLPSRYDSDDAIFLQCLVSNITMNKTDAVDGSSLSDKGLPPQDRPKELQPGEKACFRSHTNLWRRMIQENWPSLLILESDAAWDVNIRDINYRIAKGLDQLIRQYKLSQQESHPWPHPDDPFNIGEWDLISFGSCKDGPAHHDKYIVINDPDSPVGVNNYFGIRNLTNERVVRKAGNMVCTNSYAVSRQGALKLLLRSALYQGQPVDVAMGDMIRDGDLNAYSIYPPPFAQWEYIQGIGAAELNSNIRKSSEKQLSETEFIETWAKIKAQKSVWALNKLYKDASFRNGALQAVAQLAYGKDHLENTWKKIFNREKIKGEFEFRNYHKKQDQEKKKIEKERKKKEDEEKKKKEDEERKKKEEEEREQKQKEQEEEMKKQKEEEEKKKQQEEEEEKKKQQQEEEMKEQQDGGKGESES